MAERADARALAKAKAKLAREFEEIKAADAAIVNIAAMLPQRFIRQIGEARKSLTRSILALRRSSGLTHTDSKEASRDEDPAQK